MSSGLSSDPTGLTMHIFTAFTSFAALFGKQECKWPIPPNAALPIRLIDPPAGAIEGIDIHAPKTARVGDGITFGYVGEFWGDGLQESTSVAVQWPNGTIESKGGSFSDLCSCKPSEKTKERWGGEHSGVYHWLYPTELGE
jgi:hypothetical protein